MTNQRAPAAQLRDSKSGFSKVTCLEQVFRPLVPRDANNNNNNNNNNTIIYKAP